MTQQRLLSAGLEMFAENGCAGTTLEMIAAKAGVSRGAVYWHFKGRSKLLQMVLEQSVLPVEQFAVPGSGLTVALVQLEAALEATFTQTASRQLCGILVNNREPLGHACLISLRLQRAQQRFCEQMEVILDEAVLAGELAADFDVRATGHFLKVFLMGLLFECSRQPLQWASHIASTLNVMRAVLCGPVAASLAAGARMR